MFGARSRHPRRWLAAGLLVCAVLALAPVLSSGDVRSAGLRSPAQTTSAVLPAPTRSPGAEDAPPTSGVQFGASVNRLFENPAFTASQVSAALSALHATGATLARSDALWEYAEPTAPVGGRHTYDWSFDDRVAGALAAHDLRWLPIIDYSAGWAQSIPGQDHSPPATAAGYADYAAAFAARYGPGGAFWSAHPNLPALGVSALEAWNEPDNPTFWAPAPEPARYAELYLATRDAVASVAPRVQVLVGGLWHPPQFLPALLASQPQLIGHMDGIAVHPYGPTPGAIVASVSADRRLLSRLGIARVPLWVTEFGWTTSPPGARDYLAAAQRPGYLASTLTGLARARCGVAAVLAYTWATERQNPGISAQWYGIADVDGTENADVAAFGSGVRAAGALNRSPGSCPGS
jgi:polysaccharide biosynthesis protein PslG